MALQSCLALGRHFGLLALGKRFGELLTVGNTWKFAVVQINIAGFFSGLMRLGSKGTVF